MSLTIAVVTWRGSSNRLPSQTCTNWTIIRA